MNIARWLMRLTLGQRLPITSGTLRVNGLDEEIIIRRDEWGVPHITGSTDHDMWFALGFCHAQDRAFQLEMLIRLARGNLAEIVGSKGLPADRMARRLGFLRGARRQMNVIDQDVISTLESYAVGISCGLAIGAKSKAHEFVLLRAKPSRWNAEDVLAVAKLLSFAMSGNWAAELARFRVLIEDGHESLTAVDPEYAAWHPVTTPVGKMAGEQIDLLSADLATLVDAMGFSGGSNAWAVASPKTVGGRPIIANDPHLPPTLPSPWYIAHLDGGDWRMAGATFVGVPIVASGHNDYVAWGITLGLADTSDLYIEDLSDPNGESQVVETVSETIRVRGTSDHEEIVEITLRGPVLTQLLDESRYSISIKATWMQPRPVHGFLKVQRAKDAEQFREAFRCWPLMSLNLVFADVNDTIGWQLVGETPLRKSGYGVVPSPAWLDEGQWESKSIPFNEMPHEINPDVGYLVSANQRPVPEGTGQSLGVDWADGLRAARIGNQLSLVDNWDVVTTRRLQSDVFALQWYEVREFILAIHPKDDASGDVLELLAAWDGMMDKDSAAAVAFELLLSEIDRQDVNIRAPRAGSFILGADVVDGLKVPNMLAFRRAGRMSRMLMETPEDRSPGVWENFLSDVLADVSKTLSATAGGNVNRLQWGQARPLFLRHRAGEEWLMGKIFNIGPLSVGGDTNTVAQAAVDPLDTFANPMLIPSLRMVIDVGDFGRSTFIIPGGQSGNPLSHHYQDMLPLWEKGDGAQLAWLPEQVERTTINLLRLIPDDI